MWDGVILDGTWIKKAEFDLREAKEAVEATSRAKTPRYGLRLCFRPCLWRVWGVRAGDGVAFLAQRL